MGFSTPTVESCADKNVSPSRENNAELTNSSSEILEQLSISLENASEKDQPIFETSIENKRKYSIESVSGHEEECADTQIFVKVIQCPKPIQLSLSTIRMIDNPKSRIYLLQNQIRNEQKGFFEALTRQTILIQDRDYEAFKKSLQLDHKNDEHKDKICRKYNKKYEHQIAVAFLVHELLLRHYSRKKVWAPLTLHQLEEFYSGYYSTLAKIMIGELNEKSNLLKNLLCDYCIEGLSLERVIQLVKACHICARDYSINSANDAIGIMHSGLIHKNNYQPKDLKNSNTIILSIEPEASQITLVNEKTNLTFVEGSHKENYEDLTFVTCQTSKLGLQSVVDDHRIRHTAIIAHDNLTHDLITGHCDLSKKHYGKTYCESTNIVHNRSIRAHLATQPIYKTFTTSTNRWEMARFFRYCRNYTLKRRALERIHQNLEKLRGLDEALKIALIKSINTLYATHKHKWFSISSQNSRALNAYLKCDNVVLEDKIESIISYMESVYTCIEKQDSKKIAYYYLYENNGKKLFQIIQQEVNAYVSCFDKHQRDKRPGSVI